ncbi:HTH domain-containing protein [bacterium]|nr:MAG: HTH domain-containing protein [bacterium]
MSSSDESPIHLRGKRGAKALTPERELDMAKTYATSKTLTAEEVAKAFGISRRTLYNTLKRLGVKPRVAAPEATPLASNPSQDTTL